MRSHRVPHTHLPLLPSFGHPLLSLPLLPELNLSQRLPPQPQLMLVLPTNMAVTEAKGTATQYKDRATQGTINTSSQNECVRYRVGPTVQHAVIPLLYTTPNTV